MALKQRNTVRLRARIGTWFRSVVLFIVEVLQSLLNFREKDELRTKGIRTADFAVRRAMYFVADYGLTALSVSIGIAGKALGFSLLELFGALWMFDFVAAGVFVLIYEMTGKDLSLGEDFRRATDTINGKSRLAGLVATLWIVFLAIIWMGPEKIITFFRREIGTIRRVATVLLILTAIQAFIWAALYSFAYDLVTELF